MYHLCGKLLTNLFFLISPHFQFQTTLDKATTEEKLKDPLVIIFLAWIVGISVIATVTILSSMD